MSRGPRRGAGALAVLLLGGLMSADAGAAAVPVAKVAESPAAVRGYWTPARMRAAQPAEVLAPALSGVVGGAPDARAPSRRIAPAPAAAEATGAGSSLHREVRKIRRYPKRTHGVVFFTQGGVDFQCSGTAVRAPSRRLAWTAGHCVYESGGFATNWEFIPAYRDGNAPFGEWPATALATTGRWKASENLSFDVGAAILARNGRGKRIQEVIGARGIAFNQPRDQHYKSYGYPGQAPPPIPPPPEFDGEHMFRCSSDFGGRDSIMDPPEPMWIPCDMSPGSSGGGWVIENKYVASVNSYKYLFSGDRMYGPYFGNDARALYRAVKG
jgi:hypothetical protein